jgi:outer membrane protein assembly factor BamB
MKTFHRLCSIALAVLAALAAGADWPQFLGPARNSTSPETGLLASWPRTGPPVLWQKEVGEGYSSPVVAAGRLILFHRVDNDEIVECLDAATGKELWKHKEPTTYKDTYGKGNGPRSTPAVAGGRVHVLGPAGLLLCLNLEDGKKVWQRPLLDDYPLVEQSFFGAGTSPLVEGDRVLVNVGGRDAGIVAFDAKSGKEVWKATSQAASYASPVAATLDGVRQVLFFTREGFVALDPATGEVRSSKRWRSRNNLSVNAASPLVFDGHVFLSACYETGAVLLRVKKDGVEKIWNNDESLSCHFSTPVYRDGHLYGFHGRQEEGGRLRCIEAKTGKVCWTADGYGCGSLILADGRLIVLSEQGELALVEPDGAKYRELARAPVLNGTCRAHLALAGGRLYGRDRRKLVCWNLEK